MIGNGISSTIPCSNACVVSGSEGERHAAAILCHRHDRKVAATPEVADLVELERHNKRFEALNVDQLDENRRAFREEAGSQLDKLFEHFGDLTARELELRATLVFIAKDGTSITEGELRKQIRHLKPKYDQGEIDEAVDSLSKSKLLKEVTWQN